MGAAPKPEYELERLKALHAYNILDTLPETEFDDIVSLASTICNVPISLISLIDSERQWFKARKGLDTSETHRDYAFCAHAILEADTPLIIEDASLDDRFADNPFVTSAPNIRFYAGHPLVTPDGQPIGTLCVIDSKPRQLNDAQIDGLRALASQTINLLETRKLKAELVIEQQRQKLADEVAKIGHWEMDVATTQGYWSDQVYTLHGVDKETFDPNLDSGLSFYSPEERDAIAKKIDRLVEDCIPYVFEAKLHQRNGGEIFVRSTGRPRFDSNGKLVSIFGVIQDITDSVESEQQIRHAHNFQELILNNIPDVVFVKDSEFRHVQGNSAFFELFPVDMRESIIGSTGVEEFNLDEVEAFQAKDREAFDTGFSETTERLVVRGGRAHVFYTKKIRFEDQDGQPFVLGLAQNVTERENLIARLVASNEELERFAYVCSHDLQEPLRMIRSFSEKLQEHLGDQLEGDAKGQKYFAFMSDGAERAQALISDILAYSSISADTLAYADVDIADIVQSICEGMKQSAQDRNIDITFDDLPIIAGNHAQIYQLFQNLINNGLKYQRPGANPEVHVGARDFSNHWQFSVKDNGIGIEPRHHRKIFDVFTRLQRRDQYPGTGIGLSLCKKIVERHGGNIWVESEKGAGATFYFTIAKAEHAGSSV